MSEKPTDQQRIAELEQQLAKQQHAELLRHQIMTGAATRSGQDYFNHMVMELARALGADFTLIGEIIDQGRGRVRTLALCAAGELADNIEYDLRHTPCELVLEERICSHPQQVAELFPRDLLLVEMGIEGYVGVPLYDQSGGPLGLLVALYRAPVTDTLYAETTLQLFANLTAAEIQRLKERDERLRLQQQHLALSKNLQQRIQPLDSDEVLYAIIENLPNPIFYKNRQGVYTGCNQAFCDYLGRAREAIIDHTAFDVAPSHLAEIYHQADLDLMQKPGNQTYEAQVKYADGSLRNILFNKSTIVADGKNVVGIVGIMTDITEILTAEKEMQQLRLLLRSIVNSMPSLLVTVDKQQCVTQWNLRAEEFTGIPVEDALGKPLGELLPGLTADLKNISSALDKGVSEKILKVARSLGNQHCHVDIVIYPLLTGDVEGAVIRIDNVTDIVKMEETLVQSEKMLSLGGLAAGMAHEINNPLAGILQNLQLLRSRLLQPTQANQKAAEQLGFDLALLAQYLDQRNIPQMLEMMGAAGNRAAEIVRNMLSFSRKESTQLKSCNLLEILQETLQLVQNDYSLSRNFDFRNITIDCQVSERLPKVMGIRSQLQQVFFNLLKNSAQAMVDWQAMSEPPRISISAAAQSDLLELRFIDNGPGISPEDQKRIFEPFYTTKGTGDGTGLGLSVSYFIITETHHGSLSVSSESGAGSCFSIKLPLNSAELAYHI